MEKYTEETIKFYDDNADEYFNNTKGLQDTPWLKKFVEKIRKGGRVLDLGCAFGRDTKFFVDNCLESYGVDLSRNLIEKAKAQVPDAHFSVQDLLKMDFEDGFFEGVWCSATLLHISKKDVPKALSEMNRVLKGNGILYLNLKEGEGEKFVEDTRYGGARKFYSYFSKDEITGLLKKSGFAITKFELFYDKKEKYRNTGVIYLIARKTNSS